MERYSKLLQQHGRLIMNPRLAESLRPHYASLYEWSRDRSRRRHVEKGKRASHRPRLYFDTRVLTYVSLTLAKTPHLPIKRRKVIHIGQPRNRVTREKEGYARRCTVRIAVLAPSCTPSRYLAKCGRLSGTVFLGTLKCTPGASNYLRGQY